MSVYEVSSNKIINNPNIIFDEGKTGSLFKNRFEKTRSNFMTDGRRTFIYKIFYEDNLDLWVVYSCRVV